MKCKMTMKYFILLCAVCLTNSSKAQDCTAEDIVKRPGIWKAGLKGSEGGTAEDITREKKIVAAIHTMIKSAYTPVGVEADFAGAYNRPYPNMAANGYYYRIIPLNYYCDGNTVKTAHETSTFFQIAANMFDAEIYDSAQGDRLLAEGFNVMPDMPVEKDGYYYFKETNANLGFGMSGKSSGWLITYNGKLPYAYVSRKEFLEKRKRILWDQMQLSATGYKNDLKNVETVKAIIEKQYKNDPDQLSRHMKTDYQDIKHRYEKQLAENERTYAPAFSRIEMLLKMPDTELSQPAIVKKDPVDGVSYIFTNDEDPFGKILIKPNPGYFNKKLPKSSPQFFWINVIGNDKDKIAGKFMTDVMKSVDFTTLKNMLGK